jgi:hypothetical protein
MAYFRDKDLKVWRHNFGWTTRHEAFDEIVDFAVNHDETYELLQNRSFCGIPKVIKIGATLNGAVCLDMNGRIRICNSGKFKILIKAKDFWVYKNYILVKCKDDTYRMYLHGTENVSRCTGEFIPLRDITGFTNDKIVKYFYREFSEQIIINGEIGGIDETGNLVGMDCDYVFPLPIKYLRTYEEYIMAFLEDGSLHILLYNIFDRKYNMCEIIDSPCYPLDYQFSSSVKSARFFDFI